MKGRLSKIRQSKTAAHVVPFFAFLLFMPLVGLFQYDHSMAPWWERAPEHWVYPLQTLVCLFLLWWFRGNYEFKPARGLGFAVIMGLIGIAVWIVPATLHGPLGVAESGHEDVWKWFGVTQRLEGFDPTIFQDRPLVFAGVVTLRFLRMVVAVALVEEIFWRGFLMRYLIDPDKPFWETPFGTFGRVSVLVTVLLFVAVHMPSDYLGALVYGSLACWVAIRTKSLFACVLMHGVANLVLGIYVMVTRQWGFW